ncbi:UNKNOWN [Stylonychia lemnae]|uniref:Transmembrane protein n=1 Tax=Stylonychia lemnae TaxID=5949 RepID=A0A078A8D7_STYLE|nr:UNKNOWN [Stylonychia lemnae]|eukprot:CDW77041.1 UNKNOWN [Stylonychia lemnae]
MGVMEGIGFYDIAYESTRLIFVVLAKAGIAITGVYFSLKQVQNLDDTSIPQYQETKYYYLFMSLFLLLECIDIFVDYFTDLKATGKICKFIPAKIANTMIIAFQIPFIVIGLVMYNQRISTSWNDRKVHYINYELSQNITLFNMTLSERRELASEEADEFIDNITKDYLVFSIIVAMGLLLNIYQLFSVIAEREGGTWEKVLEKLIFDMLLSGVVVILVVQLITPLSLEIDFTENQVDQLSLWRKQARFSKIASNDFTIGIESFYALGVACFDVIQGLVKAVAYGCDKKNDGISLGVKLLMFKCFIFVIPGIIAILSIFIYYSQTTSALQFDSPAVLFFSCICIELGFFSLLFMFSILLCMLGICKCCC